MQKGLVDLTALRTLSEVVLNLGHGCGRILAGRLEIDEAGEAFEELAAQDLVLLRLKYRPDKLFEILPLHGCFIPHSKTQREGRFLPPLTERRQNFFLGQMAIEEMTAHAAPGVVEQLVDVVAICLEGLRHEV